MNISIKYGIDKPEGEYLPNLVDEKDLILVNEEKNLGIPLSECEAEAMRKRGQKRRADFFTTRKAYQLPIEWVGSMAWQA